MCFAKSYTILSTFTGYAPEGSIDQSMIGEIRNFLTGSREIIEERMSELGGLRRGMESYSSFYPVDDLDFAIEQARFDYEDAMLGVYDCMEAGFEQYGYAFESEASGAEKAKKEGLFQRAKNAFIKWCAGMATKCKNKRNAAKNNALKGVWNAFYGIFMRLSRQGETLKEERQLEKAQKEAEKQTKELKKKVEAAGGSASEVPGSPFSDEEIKADDERRKADNERLHGRGSVAATDLNGNKTYKNQNYYENVFGVDSNGVSAQGKLNAERAHAKKQAELNARNWGADIAALRSMVSEAQDLTGKKRKQNLQAAKAQAKQLRQDIHNDKGVPATKRKLYDAQLDKLSFESALRAIDTVEVAIEALLASDNDFFSMI